MVEHENDIRRVLVDIVEGGNFPDGSFDIRHIERIDSFQITEDGKARFWMERHPSLFGMPTLGRASSAFVSVYYLYEIDLAKKEVTLIKQESDEPVIDYAMLADEVVDLVFEDDRECHDAIEKMATEEEVIEYAKRIAQELDPSDMLQPYEDIELPSDFKEQFLVRFRDYLESRMVGYWEFYIDMLESEEMA